MRREVQSDQQPVTVVIKGASCGSPSYQTVTTSFTLISLTQTQQTVKAMKILRTLFI